MATDWRVVALEVIRLIVMANKVRILNRIEPHGYLKRFFMRFSLCGSPKGMNRLNRMNRIIYVMQFTSMRSCKNRFEPH